MAKFTPAQIRLSRIGFNGERFNATAARIGVQPYDVHRAMTYESLTSEERSTILDRFLSGDRISDIADDIGSTQTAVLKTVRGALIHARTAAVMHGAAL
ncbi:MULTISPECIES: hypothetical protein [unclassified Caballeronia]|uniref:hypothetical protein n=1 Tax=unclassified Caballeronia TaxID=2646786 RepID=UPI002863BF52|nr:MULTISPECIES: hypothetical protein [unclassified Caballeronia]MDR5771797.1 hypothetical protein [Caballeronia sp. LZ002]MDR5847232.1 hypothetical protein [Caballeronia sp. LZ003]